MIAVTLQWYANLLIIIPCLHSVWRVLITGNYSPRGFFKEPSTPLLWFLYTAKRKAFSGWWCLSGKWMEAFISRALPLSLAHWIANVFYSTHNFYDPIHIIQKCKCIKVGQRLSSPYRQLRYSSSARFCIFNSPQLALQCEESQWLHAFW